MRARPTIVVAGVVMATLAAAFAWAVGPAAADDRVAIAAATAGPAPRGAGAADHVVLIGFDGFDPSYLGRVPTPNIDLLARRGVSGSTRGVMLPITNPSFTTLVTGAWPERTGNMAYWWDRTANAYRGQSRSTDVQNIAEAVLADGGTVAAAQYFILAGNGLDYGRPGALYTQPGGACSRRFDDALAILRQEPVDSNGTVVTVPRVPDLLAVYCDDLDSIGHDEGAESPNIDAALTRLDAQVGRLITELRELDLYGRTAIVLTGDHGMSTYTQTFGLPLNNALASAGFHPQLLLFAGQSVPATADVVVVPSGRSASIYLAGPLAGDAEALARVRAVAEQVPGTGRVIEKPEQLALHMDPRYGDLVIEAEAGWGAGVLPVTSPRGDHGSSEEVDAFYAMAGAGVRSRRRPVAIRHIDVAPTIARLLDVPAPSSAQGRSLDELLTAGRKVR